MLLDPLYAHPTSKLRHIAQCLARAEVLSHAVFWKRLHGSKSSSDPDAVDLVDLPRARFAFTERDGRLYSLDHANLSICAETFYKSKPEIERLVKVSVVSSSRHK